MWGLFTIAKLVYNYNFTRVYDTYNYSYWVYESTNITGGSMGLHIVRMFLPKTKIKQMYVFPFSNQTWQ